jgi:hypothetical protein
LFGLWANHLIKHDPRNLADDVAASVPAQSVTKTIWGEIETHSMERKISVVMTRQLALALIVMSPVISPTSGKISPRSRNF